MHKTLLFALLGGSCAAAELFTVTDAPGYNSWPMIGAAGDRIVCAYSKGLRHSIGDGERGAYAKWSADGGKTWSVETCIANAPESGEVPIGKGRLADGTMLLWNRASNYDKTHHDLYRTRDGATWEKIAELRPDPMPTQIMDIMAIDGKLVSFWFACDYGGKGVNAWGLMTSEDGGERWRQTVAERLENSRELPTEPSGVYLGNGRIFAVARSEGSGAQFQLTSEDGGKTWKKVRTNIEDVLHSTPAIVYDAKTGVVWNYYYDRADGSLRRRTAMLADVLADPTSWPEPEALARGGGTGGDAGNVNVHVVPGAHLVAFYDGKAPDTTVRVLRVPATGKVRVCMDWDDSAFSDFRLAEMCRKYGAKCTFNITPRDKTAHCLMAKETTERNGTTYHFKRPGNFDRGKIVSIPYLTTNEFAYCYDGFKVAAHLNFYTTDSDADLAEARELMDGFLRVAPEIDGQRSFGIVWSGGRKSPGIIRMAKEKGFRYCRGGNTYANPRRGDGWEQSSTTYWSEPDALFEKWYALAKARGDVFWFWGHTQDLAYDEAIWARLEAKIRRISEDPDATWIDVMDLADERTDGLRIAREIAPRKGLGHFFAKCVPGATVRVAFFGGSITEADGWKTFTMENLRKRFPETKFELVDAALGGTGSDYGVYRLAKDVLPHRPDLMFVEFLVNDGASNRLRQIEGYVRNFYAAFPESDIAFVYTLGKNTAPVFQRGFLPAGAEAFEQVAGHYGIPSMAMGLAAAKMANRGELVWNKGDTQVKALAGKETEKDRPEDASGPIVFLSDGAHPYRETGHRLYAEAVARGLDALTAAKLPAVDRRNLPAPLGKDAMGAVRFYTPEDAQAAGLRLTGGAWRNDTVIQTSWWKNPPSFYKFYKSCWRSGPGDTAISFRFKGASVLMGAIYGPGTGAAEITVDGVSRRVNFFDRYSAFWRLGPYTVCDGLDPAKTHEVTIRNLPGACDREKVLRDAGRGDDYDKHREDFSVPQELMFCGLFIEGEML